MADAPARPPTIPTPTALSRKSTIDEIDAELEVYRLQRRTARGAERHVVWTYVDRALDLRLDRMAERE